MRWAAVPAPSRRPRKSRSKSTTSKNCARRRARGAKPGPAPGLTAPAPGLTVPAPALTTPAQGSRLHRVVKRPLLGTGAAIFLLQPVVPARLRIGVVDQRQHRPITQPRPLLFHDVAVLAQKGAHIGPQQRLHRTEPGHIPI